MKTRKYTSPVSPRPPRPWKPFGRKPVVRHMRAGFKGYVTAESEHEAKKAIKFLQANDS